MNPLARLEEALALYPGIAPEMTEHILGTLLVIAVYVLVLRLARRVITRTVSEPTTRYQATAAITYVIGGIALVVLAKIWIAGVTGYATYLGLLSAGLAVALQDPLTNLVGWFFIITRRPFTVGHRIQIGPHIGDVVDIRIFRFVMLEVGNWVHGDQSTGRVVHVPNGMVFKNPVYNYDEGFGYIWNEIEVTVTFGSNWRKAKELLLKNVTEHAERISPDVAAQIASAAESFHVRFGAVTPIVWTSVVEYGIKLTVRYLCKPRQRRTSTSHIWESILDTMAAAEDVELAYPTTRQFVVSGEPAGASRDRGP
jgi:small-conductance mechanosensitive channel